MRKSLRTQLTALFLAIAIIPLLLVAIIGIQQSIAAQLDQTVSQQNEVARRVAISVSEYIKGAEDELRVLVETGDIQKMSEEEAQITLLNMLNFSDVYEQITLVDASGMEKVKVSRSAIIGKADLKSLKGDASYEMPYGMKKTYYSSISFNPENGEPYLTISIPIVDLATGEISNILVADLRFKTIWTLMSESSTETLTVSMTDLSNRVVAHPNPSIVLQGKKYNTPDMGELGTGVSGESAAIGVAPVQLGGKDEFFVIAEMPTLVALRPSINFTVSSGIALIITILVTSFFSVWITRQFTRPIEGLVQTAQSIAAGNLGARVNIESQNEIGALANTFNDMTQRLQETLSTLEQRVAGRTKALATTTEVSRKLSTILDRNELVAQVVGQVKDAFGYYHVHIYLFDEDKENLIMAGGTGEAGAQMLKEGHKIASGRGLVGRAAEADEPVLVSDTTQDENWLPNPLLPDTKSEVAVPIAIGSEVLGVLDVQHNIVNGLQQEDIDSLLSISNQTAVAIQNIRQYENTQKVASDLSVVANVGIATATITDVDQLLQEVVDLSKKSFNLYHAHIYLMNETGDALELAAGAGEVGRQMVSEKRKISMNAEQSLVVRAAHSKQGVVANDVAADPNFLPNPLLPETRAEMAVPMIASGRVIGVLDVQSDTVGHFTDVDVNIETTLASQVAVAVQNARNFQQSKKQAERETAVNLIAQKIQSATSIESALQVAARELGHALGMKPTLAAIDPKSLAGESKAAGNE